MQAPPALVVTQQLTKAYGEGAGQRLVLDRLEASFPEASAVVIRGPSGSGKTTLLNLIAGVDEPTSGTVEIAGRPITELSDSERTLFRRENIGFVFQFFNLIPTLTVMENVLLPVELQGIAGAKDRAATLLERVGLLDRADDFPEFLSGGEQQRVAVARALMNDPLLLLADEPTGNLDRENGELVMKMLTALSDEFRKTLILATHSQSIAKRADLCFRIDMGKLVEEKP